MGDGSYRLIRNHELSAGQQDRGATTGNWRPEAAKVFDPHSLGGTTTTVLDRNLRAVRTFLSLAGTERNCAGGVTPWGSWLSCEESVKSPADDPSYRRAHGYVFEVHAAANGLEAAVPLKAMGRFVHEAAVVNPASGEVYQTEDRRNGCFYKFEPDRPGRLASGRLFALRVKGRPGLDTGNRRGNGAAVVAVGERLATDWVELGQPDSEGDTLRKEAGELGAATFVRGEGMIWGGGAAAFTATSGGPSGLGQVWRFAPQSGGGGQLTLLAEAAEKCDFFMPDNIAVQPGGELILAEDNREFTRLIGLNSQGRAYPFAYFRPGASEEFSGLAFPPDGRFMVASLYEMGLTLLVTGPFRPTR